MNKRAWYVARPSWFLSVLLHLGLAAVVFGLWYWNRDTTPPPDQRLAIEATVVSGSPPTGPVRPPEPVPEPEPVIETPPETPPEPEVDVAAEEEKQKAAAAAHVAEERRVAEERLAAERKTREEAEQRKAEQAARDKAAKEKADREKAEREKAEKEKADKDRQERERAQALERARTQREAELNAQIEAEERVAAARASGQMAQYAAQITARIERAWIRPPSAAAGLECEVRVTQVPGGVVTGVQVGRCNGDETVRQSIEAAVFRASPLPLPADPALFERNLVVTFRPAK